jgi:glucose/arabinose dehydrogenase
MMRSLVSGNGFFAGRLAGLAIVALAFSSVASERALAQPPSLQLTRVASGLSSPIFATHAPGDTSRLFIAEQGGNIRILDLNTGTVNATPFLTTAQLTAGNGFTSGGERGLLGLTFDPNYATNRRFYVNYTGTSGTTFIRSFQSQLGNPNLADGASGANILSVAQPFSNHNGGWIGFGPDGFMYAALGDGGSANDPGDRALNRTQLLGKMLRISPNTGAGGGYTIPTSNPYFGHATFRQEIWSYGLRNPWRNSFDRLTGDLYMGDVGQGVLEEINFQRANSPGGENYGWRLFEGMQSTGLGTGNTGLDPDVKPIHDYAHSVNPFEGFSVTGGYVYRGPVAGFSGVYFFADYVSERLFSLEFNGNPNGPFNATNFTRLTDWTSILTFTNGAFSLDNISSFGEDANGNLYIVDHGGEIFRLNGGSIPEPGMLGVGLLAITGLLSHRRRRA